MSESTTAGFLLNWLASLLVKGACTGCGAGQQEQPLTLLYPVPPACRVKRHDAGEAGGAGGEAVGAGGEAPRRIPSCSRP